ncbi:MAG TPA: plastocyanin/azurin family copper-binding protein [Acidimicrobiales bacterium]|nr:plastocyanin/azurin family copper-binding protein [Acidimicrobiales bacterium]
MTQTRGALGVVVITLVVVALGACGSDDDGDSGEGASTSIEATATDFEFDPTGWTVPAGEEFTIDFTNDGGVEHEWAVLKAGDDIESEDEFAEEKVLFEVEAIEPGTDTSESFTVAEAGEYQVICAIETHFDAGMEGTLTVE